MQLNLDCPAPADPAHLSQHERQLAGIRESVQSYLLQCAPALGESLSLSHNHQAHTDVSGQPGVTLTASGFALTLRPLCAGSSFCNAVQLQSPDPDLLPVWPEPAEPVCNDLVSEHYALQYARHQPLPANLDAGIYHARSGTRVLLLLDAAALPNPQALAATRQRLERWYRSLPAFSEASEHFTAFLCTSTDIPVHAAADTVKHSASERTVDARSLRQTLSSGLGLRLVSLPLPRDAIASRLALMAKADLVISASTGIIHDAVALGVPAAFWGTPPQGLEAVQQLLDDYLLHHDGQRLRDQQYEAWRRYVRSRLNHDTVANEQQQLLLQLETALQLAVPGWTPEFKATVLQAVPPLQPVVAPVTVAGRNTLAQRIHLSVARQQRKLTKFRESPTRFVTDSQHPLITPWQRWLG